MKIGYLRGQDVGKKEPGELLNASGEEIVVLFDFFRGQSHKIAVLSHKLPRTHNMVKS